MIGDAKVEVICDAPGCSESIEIGLPFTYPDYSGKGGRYDHRPVAVNPLVKREGWVVSEDGDKHFCEEHSPEGVEEDEQPEDEE